MKNRLKLIIISLVSSGLSSVMAQNCIPAVGGNATGPGGTISYTIGQIVYTSVSGNNGSIIQGVQQPFEISVVTGVELTDINLSFSVYPNPTTDFLILKIENQNAESYSFWLYNLSGNLLLNKKVEGIETQIGLQNIPTGTYFLKVTNGRKELKTFKIIKN